LERRSRVEEQTGSDDLLRRFEFTNRMDESGMFFLLFHTHTHAHTHAHAQHACGDDPTTFCTMVLQYACDDTLKSVRDGYPSGALQDADENNANYDPKYMKASFQRNNGDGTNTIPVDAQSAVDTEYGMHESFDYYQKCSNVERNHGLYNADRRLGCDARYTRQQPNGNRYGYIVSLSLYLSSHTHTHTQTNKQINKTLGTNVTKREITIRTGILLRGETLLCSQLIQRGVRTIVRTLQMSRTDSSV